MKYLSKRACIPDYEPSDAHRFDMLCTRIKSAGRLTRLVLDPHLIMRLVLGI